MKISVKTNELNEALSVVTKALTSNTETKILTGIFFSAYENELFLKCSDSSVQIETTVPAMVEEEGAIVLPGRLTFDLMRRMKGETVVFETTENMSVNVKCGKSRSKLQYFDASTYPKMEEVRTDTSFMMKQKTLRSMIKQTVFCCAGEEEGKAILRGVLVDFSNEGMISFVALDGFRLAIRTELAEVKGDKRNVVVPSKTMQDISNIISDVEDEVSVTISATHITIAIGTTSIKARLLKGEYINYRNIINNKTVSKVFVKRAELLESLEIASLIAKESQNNLVKFDFTADTLNITARSEIGTINENVRISTTGTPIEIAFNVKFLLDIVKSVDDEGLVISFNTSVTPCIIEPEDDARFFYLVLPVRLMKA